MEPTLYSDNILVTERISSRLNSISRGDIIIAKNPSNPQQFVCKRVIGLPGDKIITQSAAAALINPFASSSPAFDTTVAELKDVENMAAPAPADDEPASMTQKMFRSRTVVVPRGHVWLEGDNAANSSDSRHYGPVPQGLIKSRAFCRLWPPSQIRML